MEIIRISLLICLLSYSAIVHSSEKTTLYSEFSSPLHETSAKKVVYVGGSLTLALLLFFEDSIIDGTQEELAENNKLGSYNDAVELMGRTVPNGLYAVTMYGLSLFNTTNKNLYLDNATIMFKATLYAGIMTNILKYTVREKRPYGGNRNSFPSGHTTTAFAFASVIATRHPWYAGIAAYSLATLVGYQRITGNRHYLHDVIAGATIGTTFGLGMSTLYDKQERAVDLAFVPLYRGGKMIISYNF